LGYEGWGKLTSHQKVESITKVSLVTEEVNATFLFLFTLFIFRAKSDTATKDNVGVFHSVAFGSYMIIAIRSNIEVCSRTHLANVSGEGTFHVLWT